jgi:hypothetical protein
MTVIELPAAPSLLGCDYAWNKPPVSALRPAGFHFAARYLSPDASKDLSRAEAAALRADGLAIVVVHEYAARGMTHGYAGGVSDATSAHAQLTKVIGLPDMPIYFACDFDASLADQTVINAYLDGAASVIGLARVGIYGGYWPLTRARAARKATYFWGTVAWSGGMWSGRTNPHAWTPHIMQGGTRNVAGVSVDVDYANTADYGQFPRPAPPPPPVPAPELNWDKVMARLPGLHQGSSERAHILTAQWLLNRRAATPQLKTDGVYGPKTHTAVQDLQDAHHWVATGRIGAPEWAVLITGSAP